VHREHVWPQRRPKRQAITTSYAYELDSALNAWITVKFTRQRRDIIDYAVLLLIRAPDQTHTVRLYDAAHTINEMHRHSQTNGKHPAEVCHLGTLSEGLQAAIQAIQDGYQPMIEAWQTP
jgi:hypothetical protein